MALGDSFSSGEGVPPFIAPSDTNGCHRSTKAYPLLLDQDPSLNLNLQSFRACSGVTTQTMVSGWHDDGNQLNAINADTDVVTLTVGGNDVGFVDYARACVLRDCSENSPDFQTIQDKISNGLSSDLTVLLNEVSTRLSQQGSTARFFVVGYPRMMPYDDGSWPNCGYLSTEDRAAIRLVTTNLNTKIADAVYAKGHPFTFVNADLVLDYVRVSPFADHELCSAEGYFNGVRDPEIYSFHPNTQGHQAYAGLVKQYIQSPNS